MAHIRSHHELRNLERRRPLHLSRSPLLSLLAMTSPHLPEARRVARPTARTCPIPEEHCEPPLQKRRRRNRRSSILYRLPLSCAARFRFGRSSAGSHFFGRAPGYHSTRLPLRGLCRQPPPRG